MIARTWHGVVPKVRGDSYFQYLQQTGIPGLQNTPGNRGVYVLRRVSGDEAHFLMISLWDSYDSIKKFAGEDVEKARYYPEDADYLIELEPLVTHYEVLHGPELK